MKPVILLLLLFAVVLILLLIRLYHLCQSLRQEHAESLRLRALLQLGSHRVQTDLEELRRLRHDLRHYRRITGAGSPPGEVVSALDALLSHPRNASMTRNWTLSLLVEHYRRQAEELGFQADLRFDLAVSRDELLPDLCLLLSNLLENAVEALQREGGGWLRARSIAAPGYISIVVVNSCSRPLHIRNGRYLSSKQEGRLGIGLATVQEIARRYGGSAEFSADGKEFRAAVFLSCLQPERAGQHR